MKRDGRLWRSREKVRGGEWRGGEVRETERERERRRRLEGRCRWMTISRGRVHGKPSTVPPSFILDCLISQIPGELQRRAFYWGG